MNPLAPVFLAAATAAATLPTSVWDGIYSAKQAARGKEAYLSKCARCHGDNLLGGEDTQSLVDQAFRDSWEGLSVGELVESTRKTMPDDGPGELTRRQSTDLIAFLLSENEYPAGENDLKSNLPLLNQIIFEPKP